MDIGYGRAKDVNILGKVSYIGSSTFLFLFAFLSYIHTYNYIHTYIHTYKQPLFKHDYISKLLACGVRPPHPP